MPESKVAHAFDAIYEEAQHLKSLTDLDEIRKGLEVIQALARYQFDIRGKTSSEESSD
jgi:hypothetical protein